VRTPISGAPDDDDEEDASAKATGDISVQNPGFDALDR
jgi:hypothetical protein